MKFGKSAVKSLGFTFFLMLISFGFESQDAKAQECMLGEIRMFAGNFAPRKWAFSAGQEKSECSRGTSRRESGRFPRAS